MSERRAVAGPIENFCAETWKSLHEHGFAIPKRVLGNLLLPPLDAFNDDHVGLSCAMPHFARFAVFLAVEPFFGPLHRVELEHDNALRVPIAFEHFGFATADDIFAAVLMNRRGGLLFVFFVADWINNFDFDNHVSWHFLDRIYRMIRIVSGQTKSILFILSKEALSDRCRYP
jgi:hypothetical protein